MTEKKTPMFEWFPYIVDEEGKRARLFLPDKYYSIPQIQHFFVVLPHRYPELVGKRIDFEEQTDGPVRVVVPPLYGSKGN